MIWLHNGIHPKEYLVLLLILSSVEFYHHIFSVLLWFTVSDYPFGIFKLFLWEKYVLTFGQNWRSEYLTLMWKILHILSSFHCAPIRNRHNFSHVCKISLIFNMDSCKNIKLSHIITLDRDHIIVGSTYIYVIGASYHWGEF